MVDLRVEVVVEVGSRVVHQVVDSGGVNNGSTSMVRFAPWNGLRFGSFPSVYFSGWLIYDKLATRGHCLSKALFEDRNMAAGLEIGAFSTGVLIAVSAMSGDSITKMAENGEMVVHYSRDLEAIALTIVFSNIFFFTLRYLAALFISWIFQGKLDNHGEVVSYNNEIFGQHNLGASLFSISYMLAIYFMIFQADFLGTQGYQLQVL